MSNKRSLTLKQSMTIKKSKMETSSRKWRESEAPSNLGDTSVKLTHWAGKSTKYFFRQNHREIEKRRRDKMNTSLQELTSLIPTCVAMSKKIDKLTVLRLTVQHVKTLKGYLCSDKIDRPFYLKGVEIESLLLNTTLNTNFLFAIDSTRGKILHISDSVKNVLRYSNNELIGQSFFDIMHPKDISKLKEQLSSSEASNKKKSKSSVLRTSMLRNFCCGSRRSFFCRMKIKSETQSLSNSDPPYPLQPIHSPPQQNINDKRYVVMHCTGYLKSWSPNKAKSTLVSESSSVNNNDNVTCLVTVARIQPELNHVIVQNQNSSFPNFQSRFSVDGKFTYVDQMATIILGYVPQEIEGSSIYEYLQSDDIAIISEFYKNSLKTREEILTTPYRMKTKSGKFHWFESTFKRFLNPWTKEIECIIAKNQLLKWDPSVVEEQETSNGLAQKSDSTSYELQNNPGIQAEAVPESKIIYPSNDELNMTYSNSIGCKYMEEPSSSVNHLNSNSSMNSVRMNDAFLNGQEDASVSAIMSLLESDGGVAGNVDLSSYTIP